MAVLYTRGNTSFHLEMVNEPFVHVRILFFRVNITNGHVGAQIDSQTTDPSQHDVFLLRDACWNSCFDDDFNDRVFKTK